MPSKTRQLLIDVARQLIVKKGVAHTTINDIASASERGRRTVYTYFRNKKEICDAVLEAESDRLVESLRQVAIAPEAVEIRLRAFLRLRLERYVEPSATSTLIERLKLDNRRTERVQHLAREKESAMLADLLAEGCKAGVLRPDRCRMFEGFFSLTLTIIDSQAFAETATEERAKAVGQFIEFILTDLLLPGHEV